MNCSTETDNVQPAEPARPQGALALLGIPAFRLVWGIRVSWTIGIQMVLVAIGWQMYDLTRDTWALALVGLYQFVPVLLLTLPAGHAADHWPRRRIIAACLLLQAFTAAVLALGATRGHLAPDHLLWASVLLGSARAFQMPSQQALTPSTVPPSLLSRAMAASSTGTQASVIVGPALGGMLLLFGIEFVYGCAACLFGIALVFAARLRLRNGEASGNGSRATAAEDRAGALRSLFAGVHYVRRQPVILGAIMLDMFAVLFGGAIALLPVYAREILHGGPAMLGWLRAAPALGALAMSLYLVRHPPSRRVGSKLLMAIVVFGLATIAFGMSKSFVLSMIALAVNGAADMVSVVIRQTLVQMETPDDMRGRVSAVNSVFIGASNQLGEFQSGAAATLLGPVGAVVAGGAATCALALLWPKLFPQLARRGSLER